MLAHPTLDKLNAMGLAGMAKAFGELVANGEAEHLSHAEWLGLLLEREWSSRYDRKLAARLRFAKLRHQATPEDVDYRADRGLDRALFMKLLGGDWINAHDNLAICSPSGVGKSWLACALGHKACRDDRSAAQRTGPPRPAGNPRRSLWTQINDHYQPTSRVRMARRHWRPNLRRCNTRQVGPQCPPHRIERR